MTTAVQDLIVSFEKLSNPERKIAVVEILRRSPPVSSPSIEDDEFLNGWVENLDRDIRANILSL